ncbi:MAG: hypothetical protein VKJ04_00295 [Vampirovibrionales bacterium]|nr:hypothetical protein [Vampirovibrionales bacterium]
MNRKFVLSLFSTLTIAFCPLLSGASYAFSSPTLVSPIEVENIPGFQLVLLVSPDVLHQASQTEATTAVESMADSRMNEMNEQVEAQLLALEILAQAYEEYLSDRIGGYDDHQAKSRLLNTLQAVGFESKSAHAVLRQLDDNQALYPVPEEIREALQKISQSR